MSDSFLAHRHCGHLDNYVQLMPRRVPGRPWVTVGSVCVTAAWCSGLAPATPPPDSFDHEFRVLTDESLPCGVDGVIGQTMLALMAVRSPSERALLELAAFGRQ